MRILVAGGGTAGHINPNLAILSELKKRSKDLEVLYVGSAKGMESKLIPEAGWKFKSISCGKLRRYFSWENFMDVWRVKWGILQSLGIIWKFKPEVIFCKGGYVSLPVAVAGGILRKKVIIHESDAEMGLANRIAAYFAETICLAFANKRLNSKKIVITGNPVRPELAKGLAKKGWEFSGLKPGKKLILVMGGSQGSDFINKLIWNNLDNLLTEFQIIHAYGKGKGEHLKEIKMTVKDGYFACEYIGEELGDVYKISDVIVTRSGANSLAEIEFLGKPAVLIPLVFGSRGDQITNAEIFAQDYPAIILDERKITNTKHNLKADLDKLLKMDKQKPSKTWKNPAEMIAELIIEKAQNEKI